jgi:hypothetical protein
MGRYREILEKKKRYSIMPVTHTNLPDHPKLEQLWL